MLAETVGGENSRNDEYCLIAGDQVKYAGSNNRYRNLRNNVLGGIRCFETPPLHKVRWKPQD